MQTLKTTGACLLFAVSVAAASEGRRPIFEPTTISQSGSYIVTSDFSLTSGTAISVQAPQVTIDLNGKSVERSGTGGAALIDVGASVRRLTIKNGQLTGGQYAISGGGLQLALVVHRVSITGAANGVSVTARSVEVTDSSVDVELSGISAGAQTIYIAGNVFDQTLNPSQDHACGLSLNGYARATVRENSIQCEAYNAAAAIYLSGAGNGASALVDRNVLSGGIAQAGILAVSGAGTISNNTITGFHTAAINLLSDGNTVVGNRISSGSGAFNIGISVAGSHNVVSGNLVSRYSLGIGVSGSRSRIESNTVQDCRDRGLDIDGSFHTVKGNQAQGASSGGTIGLQLLGQSIVYRDNVLLGNSGTNFVDAGSNNIDGGGNLY